MVPLTIPFTRSVRTKNDAAYLEAALAGGLLHGDGPFTAKARALLSARLDGADVMLTTSCTHALEMMALLFELGPGDEVVVPSYTFPSTANAPALRGAKIVFADIDPDTFSMELPQLQAALSPRTKAVFIVEYGGVCRDIEAMVALCRERGIAVGEDAAHALFSRRQGRAYGTFGDLAALSFHNTKNISCGEGGALIINDRRYAERAHVLREKGTDRTRFLRGEVDKYTWRDVGSSWLPSDLLAAALCSQLESADELQAVRSTAWATYERLLRPQQGLGFRLQHVPTEVAHPAHVFAVVLDDPADRPRVTARLRAQGMLAVSHYEPLHLAAAAAAWGVGPQTLPATEWLAPRLLRLPLYSSLSVADATAVVDVFLAALKERG